MHLTALLRQRQNRRCNAAIQCIARRLLTMVRIAARECQACALLLCSPPLRMACPLRHSTRSDASAWRIASVGLLGTHHTSAFPRSAALLVFCFGTSSNLA